MILQQVLMSLVMNAMYAMAEMPPARRHVTISSDVRAADVDVSVCDTGPGVPADILGTLFTPFATSKAAATGSARRSSSRSSTRMDGPSSRATIQKGAPPLR